MGLDSWALGLGAWALGLGPWALVPWVLGLGSWVLALLPGALGLVAWALGLGPWALGFGAGMAELSAPLAAGMPTISRYWSSDQMFWMDGEGLSKTS